MRHVEPVLGQIGVAQLKAHHIEDVSRELVTKVSRAPRYG
jgi:hypothetical protein